MPLYKLFIVFVAFISQLSFAQDYLLCLSMGDQEVIITDSLTVEVNSDNLSFLFYLPVKSNDAEELSLVARFNAGTDYITKESIEGKNLNKIPMFSPGTGMACPINSMYSSLFINNLGHHYLIYNPLNRNEQRAELISDKDVEENWLHLKWNFSSIHVEGKAYQIKESPVEIIYCTFYIDRNANSLVDPFEFIQFTLKIPRNSN